MKNPISSFYQKKLKAQAKAAHEYFNVFKKTYAELRQLMDVPENAWKMLDFGCGYFYPQVIFFSNEGLDIQGVDIISDFYLQDVIQDKNSLLSWLRRSKLGIERKIQYWSMLKLYFRYIEYVSGKKVNNNDYRALSYNGKRLPFNDGEFNVIISNSVLESVEDIPITAADLRRVIQKEGVINLSWKNYYSFSGNIRSFDTNLRHPWGHLSGELEDGIKLNQVRPEYVKEIFSRHFRSVNIYFRDINHLILPYESDIEIKFCTEIPDLFEWERKDLLFSKRKELLQKYPEKLLLSRGFKLICKA